MNRLYALIKAYIESGGNSAKVRRILLNFAEGSSKRISEAERLGIPKGDRGNISKNGYVPNYFTLGDEAVLMFQEYGGTNALEDSPLMQQIIAYVPEARERYGLVGNTAISDQLIAEALYKQALELGQGTGAVYPTGEPLIMFRGDTKAYTNLRPRMSPEELAGKRGTMDNSLGTLFLGEFPGTADKRTRGLERYIGTGRVFNGKNVVEGSGTGADVKMKNGKIVPDGSEVPNFPQGTWPLVGYNTRFGLNLYYKLPARVMTTGVNDINAAVVLTPAVRDASREISVLNDGWVMSGAKGFDWHGPKITQVEDKDGFPLLVDEFGNVVGDALGGSDGSREAMAKHYRYVLDDAQNKGQGLLKSEGELDGASGNVFRDEHDDYTYYAVPNFNINGAKWLLPYDLRTPRNWRSTVLLKRKGGKLRK